MPPVFLALSLASLASSLDGPSPIETGMSAVRRIVSLMRAASDV